jgi:hypothetical protein
VTGSAAELGGIGVFPTVHRAGQYDQGQYAQNGVGQNTRPTGRTCWGKEEISYASLYSLQKLFHKIAPLGIYTAIINDSETGRIITGPFQMFSWNIVSEENY